MEYILLVIKPRALNTFLDGLAELGVDKCLIKNKILSDLPEKENVYRENNGEGHHDSNCSDNSDGKERQLKVMMRIVLATAGRFANDQFANVRNRFANV